MKSLSAYSVTMLAPLLRKRNAEKNDRSDFSDTCVVVVHRRLYSALALGHAPQVLGCVLVLAVATGLLPRGFYCCIACNTKNITHNFWHFRDLNYEFISITSDHCRTFVFFKRFSLQACILVHLKLVGWFARWAFVKKSIWSVNCFTEKHSMLQSLLTVIALPIYALWAQGQRNGDECHSLAL